MQGISKELLIDQGYKDVAPVMSVQLAAAYNHQDRMSKWSVRADAQRMWVGRLVHVVGVEDSEGVYPPIFEHDHERTPLFDRLNERRQITKLRRLQAKVHPNKTLTERDEVDEFRWATDDKGSTVPIRRVNDFTAVVGHLQDEPSSFSLGHFKRDVATDWLGRVSSFTTITARMFDGETFQPLVEVYDLGTQQHVEC